MSCCSGSTQTRKMTATLSFRPDAVRRFQIVCPLKGRDGRWQGNGSNDCNFGTEFGCGGKPAIGLQTITAKIQLECAENGPSMVLSGTIDIKVVKKNDPLAAITRFRRTLPSVVLNCSEGGPTCTAEWIMVFTGELLGTISLSIFGTGL